MAFAHYIYNFPTGPDLLMLYLPRLACADSGGSCTTHQLDDSEQQLDRLG